MTEKSVALPLGIVKKFTLDTVRVQFVQINQEVNNTYQTPFPKQRSRLISWYEYQHLEIELDENGQVKGGLVWLVAALPDFTFVRSVAAPAYGKEGGHCYDPVSLFLLHLFAFLDGYTNDVAFVRDLRHPEKRGRLTAPWPGSRSASPAKMTSQTSVIGFSRSTLTSSSMSSTSSSRRSGSSPGSSFPLMGSWCAPSLAIWAVTMPRSAAGCCLTPQRFEP